MRPIDEPIPGAEALYRTLRPDQRDGEFILPEAVDPDGTSVAREKYLASIDACFDPDRKEQTALAVITPDELPPPFLSGGGMPWEFRVYDKPEETNLAHAEIRACRQGTAREVEQRPKKPPLRALIRELLAKRFRFVTGPISIPADTNRSR